MNELEDLHGGSVVTYDYVRFFVPGDAKTSGSKRAFINPKTGKPIITAANPAQKKWADAVKWKAMQVFERRIPFTGPLYLELVFVRARPKGHFGTGKNEGILKEWAKDLLPEPKPDSLKLARNVEDALTKIIYIDDSQICKHEIEKVYGLKPGVDITVRKLKP